MFDQNSMFWGLRGGNSLFLPKPKRKLAMRSFAKLLFCVLSVVVTKINSLVEEATIPGQEKTKVVNHAFCDSHIPEEDKMGKKTLEEVHTYAELKLDPRASLPDSFSQYCRVLGRHFKTCISGTIVSLYLQ